MSENSENLFNGFNFSKPGGNSNFRLLKELLLASENLEAKVGKINQDLIEFKQCINEVKQRVLQ